MTNEVNHQIAEKQPKKRRQAEPSASSDEKKTRLVRLRLLPIWLRIIIVAVLFIAAAVIGVIFGYSVIGEGSAGDALKWETWRHILDIVNGTE
ncbi:MAG: DNA-directed RNA polymerase subunit beta [Lysinibacillus sp.]